MSESVVLFDPGSNNSAKVTKQGGLVVVQGTPAQTEPSPMALANTAHANVVSSSSSVLLSASNPNRKSLVIVNDSLSILYVKYGSAPALLTSYTFKVIAGNTLIMDSSLLYTGDVLGIWTSVDGTARVTEFT